MVARVVRTLAAGHAAAARLVAGSPFLAALAGPARDPGGGLADPKGARSQPSFDLAEVIAAAARPVLVVIDDAHQADSSSLRLLADLAPALHTMPAAVLVTARDGDQAWQGRLDERGALLRSGLVITLPPFAENDVAGLVASLTGAQPAPDLVRVIAERSGGNPLLVAELARQLSRQGGGAAAARRAGDRAMAALAFEDAARWYQHVAGQLAAARAGDADQAAAALSLDAARLAAGDPDGGRAGFRQAADRARRAGRSDLLARRLWVWAAGPPDSRSSCSTASRSACSRRPGSP